MKIQFLIFICISFTVLSACRNHSGRAFANATLQANQDSIPTEIVKKGWEARYNNAKWYLYLHEFDRKCSNFTGPSGDTSMPLGFYNLKFQHLYSDTSGVQGWEGKKIDYLAFSYMQNDSCYCSAIDSGRESLMHTAGFVPGSDLVQFVISDDGLLVDIFTSYKEVNGKLIKLNDDDNKVHYSEDTIDCRQRLAAFIAQNREKINPWLLNEARRRNCIKN